MRRCRWLALLAVALSGCGATPPQAPLPDAKRLDASTSAISSACAESYQATAFTGGGRPDLQTLEATAAAAARKLASVYARNPAWIYQGETVSEIVRDSASMLRSCRLEQAAMTLNSGIRRFSRSLNGKA
jgi:hypothetical protein